MPAEMTRAAFTRSGFGPVLGLYRFLTTVMGPGIGLYLDRRRARGREDPERIGERRGLASLQRPEGPLVWVHAASIGEALSVIRLMERLLAARPGLHVLITTGTVTSARLLAQRLPERAMHQYVPVDRPGWVRRFLEHWRPDAAFWVESELWPNLVMATQARGIPMAMLNARMSRASFNSWRRFPRTIRRLLAGFSVIMAQDEREAGRLLELGAHRVRVPGNLKYAAGPLPVDATALAELESRIGQRPCWLVASSHEGEEEIAAYAHRRLAANRPGLLTIIIPRHPARGEAIARKLARQDLRIARRSAGALPDGTVDIYLADTLGEMGLFYRACPLALVGGSLVSHGGQNLLEPARLDCAVMHGPHMSNFRGIVDEMAARGAAAEVADAEELVRTAGRLLDDTALRQQMIAAAAGIASAKEGILEAVLMDLESLLVGLGVTAARDGGHPATGPEDPKALNRDSLNRDPLNRDDARA